MFVNHSNKKEALEMDKSFQDADKQPQIFKDALAGTQTEVYMVKSSSNL